MYVRATLSAVFGVVCLLGTSELQAQFVPVGLEANDKALADFGPEKPGHHHPSWTNRYNEPGNLLDLATAIAVSPNGKTVFVTGMSQAQVGHYTDQEYATVAIDAKTGHRKWVSRYNGTPGCVDNGEAIAVSPDGTKVFVTGASGCVTQEDYATVAYDAANGHELWVARYDGPTGDPDEATALAVTPDGSKVIVTGRSFGFFGEGRDFATVAYATTTGAQVWASRYVGPGADEETANDEALSLAISPDGSRVFVTGPSYGEFTSVDYATVSYEIATGQEQWVARYDGPPSFEDFAQAVVVSRDGIRVFVTGYSFGENTFSDITTLSYEAASGKEVWQQRHDGPASGFDVASSLAVSPDGTKVFVAGYSDAVSAASTDFTTLAYEASHGHELWQSSYNGPGNDSDTAHAVAVSPDGKDVYVTGLSAGTNNADFPFDYATIEYKADKGKMKWVDRYNGPANGSDVPEALVVSPDGKKVFVTGSSVGQGTNFDFLTLAYKP